jgi:hypothetical protein
MSKYSRVPAALLAVLGASSMSALLAPVAGAAPAPHVAPHARPHAAKPNIGEFGVPIPAMSELWEGEQLNQAKPVIKVTGDATATKVTLYELVETEDPEAEEQWEAKEIGQSTTHTGKEWTVSPEKGFKRGWHQLAVSQTLPGGHESELSTEVGINVGVTEPTLDMYQLTNSKMTNPQPEFIVESGLENYEESTANQVKFFIDGEEVENVPTRGLGEARYRPSTPFPDGSKHTAWAVTVDDAGDEVATPHVTFTVHDTPKPAIVAPSAGASVTSTPTLTFTGPANGKVRLYLDEGAWQEEVPVDAQGNASYTFTSPLAAGQHTLTATAVDASEVESDGVSVTFTVSTPPAPQPQPTPQPQPQVQPKPQPLLAPTPPQPQRVTLSSHTLTQSKPVTLGFVVSHPGTLTVTLMRQVHHRWVPVGTVSLKVKAGHGSYKLQKRFGGHTLAPGAYQVSLQTQSGHAHSKAVNAQLSVR